MKKIVWIWNHYATNTMFDRGGRHYWMARFLLKEGFDVHVFCASTIHNSDENLCSNGELYTVKHIDGIRYVVVKTPSYKSNGKDRLINMFTFFWNVKRIAKRYAEKNGSPDTIIASSVHPLTCIAGIETSKKMNAQCVSEIRDLWPESIVAYTRHSEHEPIIKLMYMIEKWIYIKSDYIIFTFAGGYDYICDKGWQDEISREKVKYINTGLDLNAFNTNAKKYIYDDCDYNDNAFFKVVYTGSIRSVNSLGWLVDAAIIAKERLPNVRFFIFGDGDERTVLEIKANHNNLNNVFFKGKVKKQEIPGILKRADLLVISVMNTRVLKYGESWNKLFEYIASGTPIVSNVGSKIIEDNHLGLTEIDSAEKLIDAILLFLEQDNQQLFFTHNHGQYIGDQFDYNYFMQEIVSLIC